MNDIVNLTSDQPTMSSREIADLTGKRHDNVRADIEKMGRELSLTFQEKDEPSEGGRPTKVILLGKRESLILVSGYNLSLRATIIDRWEELERQVRTPASPAQLSRMDLIKLAFEAESERQAEREQRLLLEAKVEEDAPKVAFAESVIAAPDAISLAQAAKILGTGRNRLCSIMRAEGWMTRINEPYQDKINARLLDVKIGSWEHPEKGLQRSVTALVTGKGLEKLRSIVRKAA